MLNTSTLIFTLFFFTPWGYSTSLALVSAPSAGWREARQAGEKQGFSGRWKAGEGEEVRAAACSNGEIIVRVEQTHPASPALPDYRTRHQVYSGFCPLTIAKKRQ